MTVNLQSRWGPGARQQQTLRAEFARDAAIGLRHATDCHDSRRACDHSWCGVHTCQRRGLRGPFKREVRLNESLNPYDGSVTVVGGFFTHLSDMVVMA